MDKFCIDSLCVNMPEQNRVNASCVDTLPLAMAYMPIQKWEALYDNDVALSRGTLFQKLDLPFLGKKGVER